MLLQRPPHDQPDRKAEQRADDKLFQQKNTGVREGDAASHSGQKDYGQRVGNGIVGAALHFQKRGSIFFQRKIAGTEDRKDGRSVGGA